MPRFAKVAVIVRPGSAKTASVRTSQPGSSAMPRRARVLLGEERLDGAAQRDALAPLEPYLFTSEGEALGAIAVRRLDPLPSAEAAPDLTSAVVRAARSVSRHLGYRVSSVVLRPSGRG